MGVVDSEVWRRLWASRGRAVTDDGWNRGVELAIRLVPTLAYLVVVRALDLAVVPALVLAVVMVGLVLLLL